jgi:serine/threonine protein kinase
MKKMEHENIVKLLDVYQTSNNMYIVTEFCEEGDLRNYLKKKKKLSEQ